jgi:DNA-binding IclR family transcriptional regulator
MSVGVVKKLFTVLEALADEGGPTSLARLSGQTRISKPTLYRLLQTMCELGYATQDSIRGRYVRTAKLWMLGRNGESEALQHRARPIMEALHKRFNETINLGVLNGLNVRYMIAIESTQALRHMTQPNDDDLYYSTAVGRAIAAFLSEEDQSAMLSQTKLKAFTKHTVRTIKDLRKSLDEIRARGWAMDDEETEAGVACFAVPILQQDEAVAGISLSMPKVRLTPKLQKEIVSALLKARP